MLLCFFLYHTLFRGILQEEKYICECFGNGIAGNEGAAALDGEGVF